MKGIDKTVMGTATVPFYPNAQNIFGVLSTRTPCSDEFFELMKCLSESTGGSQLGCYGKYCSLKACLQAHGLVFKSDPNDDKKP